MQRFWRKVNIDLNTRCWVWQGAHTSRGYGNFWNGVRAVKAHRFAYESFIGTIPDGLVIYHLCCNTSCVNPSHLEAVTQYQNMRRGTVFQASAERQLRKTHCPKGHAYTGENLYVQPSTGSRYCRKCHADRERNRRRSVVR